MASPPSIQRNSKAAVVDDKERKERKRASARRYANKRYANDSAYREKAKAHAREQYANLTPEQYAQQLAYQNRRYATDEEFRKSAKARSKARYKADPKAAVAAQMERRRKNPKQTATERLTYNRRLRQEVVDGYGGRCVCCGTTYAPHLTIDHVKGDGAAERRQLGGGRAVYQKLRALLREGILDLDYQVLCWSCNMTKHHLGRCGCQD